MSVQNPPARVGRLNFYQRVQLSGKRPVLLYCTWKGFPRPNVPLGIGSGLLTPIDLVVPVCRAEGREIEIISEKTGESPRLWQGLFAARQAFGLRIRGILLLDELFSIR